MVIRQLSCRHIKYAPDWPLAHDLCPEGCGVLAVQAIECREWKASCVNGCHWARWFGQDHAGATAKAAQHKHACTVDYLQHPDIQKRVIAEYGRRMRRVVIQPRPGSDYTVRYAGERTCNVISPPSNTDTTVDKPPF